MPFQQTPWKHDPRSKNFSHQRFFGAAPLRTTPLGRARRWVLYQGNTLRCTGYAGAADGSYIHGRRFSGDWQAAIVGRIQGRSVDISGGDPNAAMKSERDYGFLPQSDAPVSLETHGAEASGMDAFPLELNLKAIPFDNIAGFVRVDGPYDHFGNIWNALMLAYDFETKTGATVRAFGRWYHEWTHARDGIIPKTYTQFAGYHAYNFIDLCDIHPDCMIAQNSYGNQIGDGGFHHFPREVINREFSQWGTSLKIVKTLKQEWIDEAKKETPVGRLFRKLIELIYNWSERYGGPTQSTLLQLIRLLTQLRDLLASRQTLQNAPQPAPVPKPTQTPTPPRKDRLEAFCGLIRTKEGWYEGSRSYRNNNPGNCRYSTKGYLAIYGTVKRDKDNFAIFKDYATGWLYLKNLVLAKTAANPTWTIRQFIDEYAPASDGNDPEGYAKFIAKGLGVPVDTPLRSLFA